MSGGWRGSNSISDLTAMASSEDRQHAERLIKKKRGRLFRLEEQAATMGIDTPPHVQTEIDDLRADIATLEAIAAPEPGADPEVKALTKRSFGDGDWAMLFTQYVLINTRLTKVEEATQTIQAQQGAAQIERLQTKDDVQEIKDKLAQSERKRTFWQPVYLGMWIMLAIVIVAAVLFGRIYL